MTTDGNFKWPSCSSVWQERKVWLVFISTCVVDVQSEWMLVWWHGIPCCCMLLQVFGHASVSVLDGGLAYWRHCQYPLETAPPQIPCPQPYTATYNPHLVKTMQQVLHYLNSGEAQVQLIAVTLPKSLRPCKKSMSKENLTSQPPPLFFLQSTVYDACRL